MLPTAQQNKRSRSSMERITFIFLIALSITHAVPLHRTERQVIDFDDPAASNLTANEVCFSDNEIYQRGDIMPNPGPCEECKCEPPSIVCNMIKCPVNSGCRTIQRANHCCPDYKCECEYNGEIYSNGERLDTPDEPCQVCYCKGGEVMCTSITCYHRDDCDPQLVAGQCCPKYDHCPLRDMPSASESDERQMNKNKTFVNSPKREMQPWLLTKSVFINTKPTLSTERNAEDFTTDKTPVEQTEVIISDWLAERRTTTEGELENNEAKGEQTPNTLDTTTINAAVDLNILGQDKEESSTTNEEPTTIIDFSYTTTQSTGHTEQEKQDQELENQTDLEISTDDSVVTTTGNPNSDSGNIKKSPDSAIASTEDAGNIQDLETTEPTTKDIFTTIPTKTTSQKENVKYTTGIKDFSEKIKESDDFNVSNKQTEYTTASILPTERPTEDKTEDSPVVYPDFDIPLQNGKSSNEKRSGVKYEGSAEEPLDDENDTDSILHEELSADFENIETTKFSDRTVVHTTPIIFEDPTMEEGSQKSTEKENEIKDNFTIVRTENDATVVEKQTKEPDEITTIEYNTMATTLPDGGHVEETTNDGKSEVKQTEVVSTTLFEDSLSVKVDENQSELEKTLPNPVSDSSELIPKDDSIKEVSVTLKDVETTTSNVDDPPTTEVDTTEEMNHSLKEVLTKEDTNQSELEEDSVEEETIKVKKNSEEFETKASNEEEGENNQEPPVLELNNQLPFLQLGGHGSSESSTETDEDNANQPSLRTVPETSTHITLTQGDLKILAEYLINEKIKPIGHPSKNDTSHYMPTEWLKGNLTSDVKIASILTAANISIGIMNKTNIEIKIKSLGKNGEDKEADSKTEQVLEEDKKINNEEAVVHKENTNLENATDKPTDGSTISTKLSLLTENSYLAQNDKDDRPFKAHPEAHTEKVNFETEIFEGMTTKYSESINSTKQTTDKTSAEQLMTTIIPETSAEAQTSISDNTDKPTEMTDPKEKNVDVSASRKVVIPEMESLVKEPYSVKLEDNDITIVRDFLKKHMVFP